MFTYSVIENQSEAGKPIYGVCAYESVGNKKRKIVDIPDIFFNREKAVDLVRLCNELDLDIVHLFDVIEDTIG